MKQSIILWLGAFIITFLSGYLQSLTSTGYPINGTVGIEGKKVTYKFEKVHHGDDNYKIIIFSEIPDLNGVVQWKQPGEENVYNEINLKKENGNFLAASIPGYPPSTKVEYRVKITHNNQTYFLPSENPVELTFFGEVSSQITTFCFLFLYGGLLLSTRTALEYFNEKRRTRIKMYTLFTIFAFFGYGLALYPIKRSYEMGNIGTRGLPISEIFGVGPFLLFAIWIIGMILIFNTQKPKIWALVTGIITLIIFQISF